MVKYISILRGINVGGKNKILMNDLKNLYITQGFQHVVTYIQSGNIIFETENQEDTKNISARIEKMIADKYGFNVPTLVLTAAEMKNAAEQNPFLTQKNIDTSTLFVTFLSEKPNFLLIEKMKLLDFGADKFEIIDKCVFLCCSDYGKTKLSNNFFEFKLKVTATTRNWKTISHLVTLTS